MTQFFLSRAVGDDDSYAIRFFQDLSAKVRVISGVDGDVGFVETVESGSRSPWSTAARNALADCQTFVALCSPRYFLSERCGRQWSIFAERLRRYEKETGRRPPALISVPWGDSGGGEAVRQLIRLRSHRPRYEALLASVARQIMETIEEYQIPPMSPSFDPAKVPNAFGYAEVDSTDHAESGSIGQKPPRKDLVEAVSQRVHFIVAAGTRAEMDTVREDLRFYGERGRDWAAYRPALAEPLVAHARALAAEQLFGSDVAELDDLAERLDRARRNNEIVVVLVDAWITKLASYRRMLAEFDSHAEPSVAVLAPASLTDAETVRHGGELRAGLTRALPRNLARQDQLVRIEIDSPESFEVDLVAALEEAQNRIFSHGRVFRRPAQDEPVDRPILQGP
ncbi:FxsC protein [Plantactinospora sp. WMMB782]|uniref:FxsC protein n=1 Tax=Plantactinospora sp. WMMB782 TaxID=3404121 RepID=UPI003B9406B9